MLYCAHAILYCQLLDKEQETFFVHENVYLIEADDPVQADASALDIARAHEDSGADGNQELNGQKAAYLFAGIRKLIEVQSSPDPGPVHAVGLAGLEMSHSKYEVDNLEQVHALARGEMVEALYRE